MSRVDGSWKAASGPVVAVVVGAAGEGVAGAAVPAAVVEGAGAGGAAGVDGAALAGVDGACVDGAAAVEGAGLGYHEQDQLDDALKIDRDISHTLETMQTMKPFSSIL